MEIHKNQNNSFTNDQLVRALDSYLKLIYSPSYSDKLLNNENDPVIESIIKPFVDIEKLQAEHYARYKNFSSHIKYFAKIIDGILPKDLFDSLTKLYCNSEEFWIYKGRTLLENFCLFSYERLKEDRNLAYSEYIKLQGIISGISDKNRKESPWQGNHIILDKNSNITESYISKCKLEYPIKDLKQNLLSDKKYKIIVFFDFNNDKVKINVETA